MSVKAIETRYNGYRFRSRIEARWAVFFDALGIPYQYEPEGFDLDGIRYLPDFFLPTLGDDGTWFEVKGATPSPVEAEKAWRLSEATGANVLIASGQCRPHQQRILAFLPDKPEFDQGEQYALAQCRRCPGLALVCEDTGFFILGNDDPECSCTERWPLMEYRPIEQAFAAASSARFEFGESGGAR